RFFLHLLRALLLASSPLFPYTTLFRSSTGTALLPSSRSSTSLFAFGWYPPASMTWVSFAVMANAPSMLLCQSRTPPLSIRMIGKIGKHTSELQSRENLVCRLLLEKKKL